MRYKVCECDTAEKLERAVNDLIAQGWRPLGGLSVTPSHSSGRWWYYQAMAHDGRKPSAGGPFEREL